MSELFDAINEFIEQKDKEGAINKDIVNSTSDRSKFVTQFLTEHTEFNQSRQYILLQVRKALESFYGVEAEPKPKAKSSSSSAKSSSKPSAKSSAKSSEVEPEENEPEPKPSKLKSKAKSDSSKIEDLINNTPVRKTITQKGGLCGGRSCNPRYAF